ncbi:Similar to Mitochondrial distribution and morphology protein 31; acc. no. P38880 [Pyronema omphalodes CBS 100304]|uniref:Similar to Mitochondrial distribution and morphology protein 31 acc. no. P38880 n=1 Tax=Pyronema omphalodes (strain CBS 100304) TaxID=1076935 RepID=U4L9N7_PYROM|nr:Similar to Mitochondrial distribution and morphology protein 31; acc. no. P38880 [Pyronema omphalodes CBS 100304]
MLAAATNAWQRLRIRTKWSLIRQMRPYSMEDIGAFFSWLVVGHVIWILVGTTSFLTATIFVVNSVSAQETLAGFIGNYLTKETGVTVVFESAIVPRWKDNCIQFKNVFVSRRPGHAKQSRNVSKGSAETAAAAAAAASNTHNKASATTEEDDGNYTQFDVTIDTVNVTLSFARWVNGRGLLKDVEIKGVRGVIDRTHVVWEEGVDPKSYKNVHRPGDFEIEAFKIEDLLVTLYQPNGFRPFSVSIYSCDLPQLRKNWLFYDFLSANHCSGSYDDSLFTIHPRQSHNMVNSSSEKEAQKLWKKTSRLRIDGLEIDHLNRGIEGPFSWIQTGNVDIVSDVSLPVDDDLQFSKLVHDIYEHMEHTIHSNSSENSHHDFSSVISSIGKIAQQDGKDEKFIVMDLHVQLNDVRAAVPIFNKDLSYVNNAMIRPIVAYVNSRKTYIPINCRVAKKLCEFDGSWTIYDSGLMDDLSAETYDAFSRNVADEQARRRRIKKVGLWSLQLLAQAFLMAMAGSVA